MHNYYFNFINHIIAYTILTSTKIWTCLFNFRKYWTYCKLALFGKTYELTSTLHVPLLCKIYTLLRKTAIFRERMSEILPKFLSLTQKFCRIRCKKYAYSNSRKAIIQRANKMTKECPLSEICRGCLSLKLQNGHACLIR